MNYFKGNKGFVSSGSLPLTNKNEIIRSNKTKIDN